MTYSLLLDKEIWTSDAIIAALDPAVSIQRAYIALVQDLERNGCRYSYQDSDVLSAAWRARNEFTTPIFAQGFVDHWAPLAR